MMHWSAKLVLSLIIIISISLVGLLIFPHGATTTFFERLLPTSLTTQQKVQQSQTETQLQTPILVIQPHDIEENTTINDFANGQAWVLLMFDNNNENNKVYIFHDGDALKRLDKNNSGHIELHDSSMKNLHIGVYFHKLKKMQHMPAHEAGISAILLNSSNPEQIKSTNEQYSLSDIGTAVMTDSSQAKIKVLLIPTEFLRKVRFQDMHNKDSN